MDKEKIKISVNEEDVQNIINCYEKDIEYIKQLEQENQQLKEVIKRCYTPEEIDFEIMPVKAKLEAEKDINNNLHKTIDKLRVTLYETQQENNQLKERINKAIEYIEKTKIGSILEVHCGEEEEYTEPLLEILKGENQ